MGSLYAKDVVYAWLSQVGYECGPNKWNKYAELLDKVDYFTGCGKKQYLDFCAIGLCWGAYVSVRDPNYEDDPESAKWAAHYFLYQSDSCDMAAVVKYLYQYFADNDAITDNPERGDIAIFQKSDGTMYHCGGVTDWDWDADEIYITEFNTEGGKVKTHIYSFKDIGNKIKCFGRPRYDGWEYPTEEDTTTEPVPEPTPEPAPEPPVADNNKGTEYTVCVGSWLNIREEPDSDSTKLGELYDGAKVIVYEVSDGWGKIGPNMWIYMEFLD